MDVQQIARSYVEDPNQKPNYDGFVVIGAGLPRTGTMSMRAALGQVIGSSIEIIVNTGLTWVLLEWGNYVGYFLCSCWMELATT